MAKFNLNSLLSGTSLNNTGAEEATGEEKKIKALKVVSLSVHDLIPSKENFYSVDDITELKDSIEMFGVKQNLTVKRLEGGKYMVIAGHRRRLASLSLVEEGKKEFEFIPCAIETELDQIKEQLLLITTNATARQLTDWEKTQQAEKMRELLEEYKKNEKLPGRMRELIAQALKTSSSQIGRMESISKNLSPDFKEEFKDRKINISTAYELSTLPEEAQQQVFAEYEESGNLSIKDVKEKKAEVKATVEEEQADDEPEVKENREVEETKEEMTAVEEAGPKEKQEEVKGQKIQEALKPFPTIFEILKDMSIEELAEFICYRCDGQGGFCDWAIMCNQSEKSDRQQLCMKWLKSEAQKRG
ncbi:MAG: ParB/RepB/Spo0J family partition protein [Vallitaleaceae bacterium]|nr:ParB/RepB/Spo0J family partition protein [Vallitaleaceae bacterium]